jgi:hypothetical protein
VKTRARDLSERHLFEVTTVAEKPIAVAVSLFFWCYPLIAYAGDSTRKTEEISGVVIAYNEVEYGVAEFNCRQCTVSLLVRSSPSEVSKPRFIVIHLLLTRSGKFPKEIVEAVSKNRPLRFKLTRAVNLDGPVEEFLVQITDAGRALKKWPVWAPVPGAEGESLPFGETPPAYMLAKDGLKLAAGNR